MDPGGNAVIAGRAAPNAKVTVLDGDKPLGDVTADRRGEWVLLPPQPIMPGDRQLSLEAANPGNGDKVPSNATVALSVPPRNPAAGPGAGPGARPGESALAVLLPRDGAEPARPLQVPGTGSATAAPAMPTPASGAPPSNAPVSGAPSADGGGLSLDTAEYDQKGHLKMSGRAAPGASLRAYLGDEPLGSVTAGPDGRWSLDSTHPVPSGKGELRVERVTPQGAVAERAARPFERATERATAAAVPHDRRYVVRPGNNLWVIARRTYGDGVNFTIIYSANAGRIHDPDLIYPGQVFKLPRS